MEGLIYEVPHNNNVAHIVEGKDLETLAVASIQTWKRNNKKYGIEEVFHSVQEPVESEVTKEIFEERLDELLESHSVKITLLGTRTCLSLPKSNQDSNSKENIDETLVSNDTLTLSENEELIKFKNSIIDEFDALKSSFFAEVNSFENKHLNSYSKTITRQY